MKRYDNIIGIDPDVTKSGVAYYERDTKRLELSTLTFPALLDYLQFVKKECEEKHLNMRVIIEAGWLHKNHWHVAQKDTRAVAAAKGNHAGRNHEVGRKIVEMCEHWKIPHELALPLRKQWKGTDGKITHDELNSVLRAKNIPTVIGRTNQENRDACLIVVSRL